METIISKKAQVVYLIMLSFFNFLLKIEAQNIPYTSLFTNSTFTKTIDVNLPVGTINGTTNVSGGAAGYSIPLILPAGTNGVNPELTLNYNSWGSNGPIGNGWSISGFSLIARTNKDLYHDGNTNPIDYSSNNRFVLDGERLLTNSGTYGGNLSTYKKEAKDFSIITSYGNYGGGPTYFKVETKDGIVFEYGNTSDSRFLKF